MKLLPIQRQDQRPILRCEERGITPLSGNKCGLYGHVYSFFVRHTHWKQIFFRYVSISNESEKEGDGTYRLTCETAGTVGNNDVGTIFAG